MSARILELKIKAVVRSGKEIPNTGISTRERIKNRVGVRSEVFQEDGLELWGGGGERTTGEGENRCYGGV